MNKDKFGYASGQGITIIKREKKQTSQTTDKTEPDLEQEDG
jgi:hypothetical protein